MKRHERAAKKRFRESVRAHVAADVPKKRGMSEPQYIEACTALWNRCQTDDVFSVKMFVEPLIDTHFAQYSTDIFCLLVARCDPAGDLIDAPPGYQRVKEPGIFLTSVVMAAPPGVSPRRPLESKVETHLFAYFDILGFKNRLKKEKIENIHKAYLELIENAVKPQQGQWATSVAYSPGSSKVAALMWMPIEAGHASDSLVLYVPYHPSYVEEFFRRAALLFCVALRLNAPLRGAITFGQGAFHAKTSVFVGQPLVEASSLEQCLDWLGVVFGESIKQLDWRGLPISPPEPGAVPIPLHLVQDISPPMSDPGKGIFGGLVLDWPRVWRQTFEGSAIPYLATLCDTVERDEEMTEVARDRVLARFEHAAYFFEFSDWNQNWCIPPGFRMITPDDVANNPLEGLRDKSFFYRDWRYEIRNQRASFRKHLQLLCDWTRPITPRESSVFTVAPPTRWPSRMGRRPI
ncbi:hypothetical protein [Bradyrhizobium sp.]|uniref:hypothetical protein n=1 Tax=Bradyrhizobium sp. TaxID=376 RepID=UPI004037F1FC